MEAKDRVYQALCRMSKSDCQITAAALAEELNLSRVSVFSTLPSSKRRFR